MRTGRSETVCWCLLPGGGVCLVRGVSDWSGGVCLILGGAWSRGGGWGSAWSGGWLPGLGGLPGPGGSAWSHGGGIPACTEADPPAVNRMTDRCKNITLATTSLRPVKIRIKRSQGQDFKKMGDKIMMLLPTVVSAADSRHCRKIQQHKNSRITHFMVKMSLFWLEQFIQYINSNFFVCWAIRKDFFIDLL